MEYLVTKGLSTAHKQKGLGAVQVLQDFLLKANKETVKPRELRRGAETVTQGLGTDGEGSLM